MTPHIADCPPDMLEEMMRLQRELQEGTYGHDFNAMTDEDRIDFIMINVYALMDELHELTGEIGWKPWATSKHINSDAAKGEGIDAWHFFMNILIVLGMSPTELYNRYTAKRLVNIERQSAGYDGVSTKCPVCKRALDDPAVDCEAGICRYGG